MKAYETISADEPFADTRVRLAIVIWGDAVMARALVLLLRGSGYDAKYLSASSLSEPKVLEGVQLLLLAPAPEPSSEPREALLASLSNTPGVTEIPVIELVNTSEKTTEGRVHDRPWYKVQWPSRIDELERQIEAVLHGHLGAEPATSSEPGTQTQKKEGDG
jgi:hypothetical protein